VQRRRVNYCAHSDQGFPHEGALENRPHTIGESRCFGIKAKHRMSGGTEDPDDSFAEMTGAASNENGQLTSSMTSR
jgi:hypothetical protein